MEENGKTTLWQKCVKGSKKFVCFMIVMKVLTVVAIFAMSWRGLPTQNISVKLKTQLLKRFRFESIHYEKNLSSADISNASWANLTHLDYKPNKDTCAEFTLANKSKREILKGVLTLQNCGRPTKSSVVEDNYNIVISQRNGGRVTRKAIRNSKGSYHVTAPLLDHRNVKPFENHNNRPVYEASSTIFPRNNVRVFITNNKMKLNALCNITAIHDSEHQKETFEQRSIICRIRR